MRSISESMVMPALATRTWTGPQCSSIGGEGRLDLLRVAHVTAHGQEAVRVGAVGRRGRVGRAVGRGDLVAVGQEPLDAGRADAAGPAGDEDDGHQRVSGTRSQTSGWPSWTRSPSAASQRMTCPAKGVRTSETPDPADEVPDVDGGGRVQVVGRSGQEARPGRLQGRLGAEDAAGRADDDPLGHVEVLALVQRRLGPPGARRGDLVHQRVEVLGLGDGQGLDLGQAALGQPAQDAAGPELDERGEPQAGEGLERLAPAHRAAQLGGEQPRPLGRVVVHVRVHVGHDADLGGQEGDLGQRLAQVGARALHQGRVEGAGDLDRHDPLGTQALGQLAGQGDRVGRPGDHDLSRRVVVGHPHVALGAHAGRLGVVVRDAEERGHGPRRLLPGARHGLAAGDHQLDPVLEAEGAAGDQRGVLAQAVARRRRPA